MKKLFTILILLTNLIYADNFGKGLVFDDEEYQKTPKSAELISRDYQILPSKFFLTNYILDIGNQGKTGTCTAWATAYGARSILERIYQGKKILFSPSYIYNQIREVRGCNSGTSIGKALRIMKREGVAPFKNFGFNCDKRITTRDRDIASKYKIKDYKTLFWINDTNKILPVKKAISEKKPVVIGMKTPNSFNYAKELWIPKRGDYYKRGLGGHAMVVVGYDNNKYGGAFLLMNSWGRNWGKNGFTYIRYSDFKHFVRYAYELISFPPKKRIKIAGEIKFIDSNGDIMSATYNKRLGIYQMDKPYYSGTKFNFFIKNNTPIYLYAFGFDSTQKTFTIFPYKKNISPFISYKNSTIAFPDENHYIEMDNTKGEDYFVILYSLYELNIEDIKSSIENSNGDFKERLKRALGKSSINSEEVNFSKNRIKFKYSFESGLKDNLVAIIIKFIHK